MSFKDMTDCLFLPLPEVLSFIVDNRGKTVPTTESGIPLIKTNCIRNDELYPVFEKIRYISKETYNNWFRAHPIPGDIIFVNKGAPGRVCLVPNPVDFCIAQDMMAFRVNEKIIYNKYLFAVLRSSQFQTQIEHFHVGTLIPHFKKGDLDKLLIPVPSMSVQRYIGDTYYTLSNKIELNNQINKTLEEMAQAIFKSWFVDFEPFQDGEFEDSEIGKIPKGWSIKPIYDFADYINGTSFKKHEYKTNGCPIIKIAELKNGITNSTQYFNGVKDSKYFIKTGELLFSWSGNPQTSIDIFLWVGGDAILNQHTFKVSIINDDYSFVFLLLKNLKPEFTRIASSKQTTGLGHVTVGDLKRLKFPFNDKAVSEFTTVIDPIIKKYINNLLENNKLNAFRDALLPKLMSGEIRVPIEEV